MTIRAVDCQGFAGAFALGVVQAGFELVGKRENVGGFGIPLMEGNRDLLGDTWLAEACDPSEWSTPRGGADLVFGNPPCSGFSTLSVCIVPKGKKITDERVDWRGIDSAANTCMWDLIAFAARCKPTMVIFESVQGAGKQGRSLMQALRDDLEQRTRRRYGLWHVFHNNLSVGGPAMRKRYFWVASRIPFGVDHVELTSIPTVRDVIGDLESVPATIDSEALIEGHCIYNCRRAHRLAWLAEHGDWRQGETSGAAFARAQFRKKDLPDLWTIGANTDIKTHQYAARRWKYDEPVRVLTGDGLKEVVHPVLPRTFTFREVARMMGYPDTWSCRPAVERQSIGAKWWGKQIPVASGRWIAQAAHAAMLDYEPEDTGEKVGEREWLIDATHDWKKFAAIAK